MNKIIIIGATSGIGRELSRIYAGAGWLVGATGRRQDLLYTLQLEFPNQVVTECFDVRDEESTEHVDSLINKMEGLDILIYNAGFGETSETLNWEIDKATVDINVNGFIKIVHHAFNYFVNQGHGHVVVTSSIASLRGNGFAPAYSASKAFQSIYFEGLHIKAMNMKDIYTTDVEPGFVDTKMAKSNKRFWVSPPKKAARQIVAAIERKKRRVYITRRWWLVARLLKSMPGFIYYRLAGKS
jgi:short-subunit dehydrogenase